MKVLSPRQYCLLAIVLFSFMFMPDGNAAEREVEIEITPQDIEITTFYHGTDIEVKGTVPLASEIALVVMGEQDEQVLSRKGRVGPLWMNVETVVIKGVPQMYYLLTSTNTLEELAPSKILMEHGIGYDTLEKSVSLESENSGHETTFKEFIKLKESMGLYNLGNGSIRLKPLNEQSARFSLPIAIPSQVPPGEYRISIYCFKEGQVVSNSSSSLTVKKTGLPAMLSLLAFNHAAIYGVLSIVIAIAVGLFMGLLFGKKEGGGH